MRRLLAAMLGLVVLASAAPSGAQSAADKDKKEALHLFTEGRKLMSEPGRLAEACGMLARSHKLVPRGDTLLNLAECNRLQGKTATAWKQFGDAIQVAESVRFDRAIDVARKRHADLEAKLSFLTLTVPPETAALPGFEVTLNGYPVPKDAWGKSVPVDPATFEIAAKADGRLPFSESVKVGADGDKRQVTVSLQPVPVPLAPPPPPPRPPPPPPAPPAPPPRIPAWTWAVGGTGVAALGVAAGFGVEGLLAKNQLNSLCGGQIQCKGHTQSELSPLNSRKDVGLGVLVGAGTVGLAAVTVAVVQIVGVQRARARSTGSLTVTPVLGSGLGGAALGGRF